jgi:hypothetical protein
LLSLRKLCVCCTLVLGILLLFAPYPARAGSQVLCFIEGQELTCDPAPFIVNGRTMVPLRAVGEQLGMEVKWLEDVRVAWIITGEKASGNSLPPLSERHSLAGPLIFVDDIQVPSDVDPVIVDGRIMIPIRVVTEHLGMEVKWYEDVRQVHITRAQAPPEVPEEPPAEPSMPEPPAHEYLGIPIMGWSQAGPADMARVAFEAVAPRIYPGITESESARYISRARDSVEGQYCEVTSLEVVSLTLELNRSSAELRQLSPAERDQILDFVACTYYKIARLYLEKGQQYGIRGDIAFFQAAHETGWWRFGGLVTPEQNNYCGLGATGRAATADELLRGANPSRVWFVEGKHGAFFDKPATGIEAQMQHLYAYATTRDLPPGVDLLSPRYILVTKGIAPNWEDLGGRWAVPGYPRGAPYYYENMPDPFAAAFADGRTYGQKILDYYFRTGCS